MGGIGGTLCGILGERRPGCSRLVASVGAWILGTFYTIAAAGVLQLLLGLYAVVVGQPWEIWYGPVLGGFIFTTVIGGLIPLVRHRYQEAEDRRILAEALRKS